jgi:hypothetical protein
MEMPFFEKKKILDTRGNITRRALQKGKSFHAAQLAI